MLVHDLQEELCSIANDECIVLMRLALRSIGDGALSPNRVVTMPTCSDISDTNRMISDVIENGGIYIALSLIQIILQRYN